MNTPDTPGRVVLSARRLFRRAVKATPASAGVSDRVWPLRQGWKPAAPEGPGRDSTAGSVRSMTARPDARCH
ncbi:hypothetical protein [Mangrovibacter phragmitis]|uniref:hypothetical protein n=1 Tax=Mangrovibacter phragmitis TaxID=1691903 RepID=UPI0035185A2E